MQWETWLMFVVTEAVLCITPGPAVLYVLSQALQRGPAKSVWASGGILTANALYFLLSATSLGAILVASYRVFFLIKWAGAAYLVYLGIQHFLSRSSLLAIPEASPSATRSWRVLRDGVFLQGANPKALLYFSAILPQFIDPNRSVSRQILILGVTSIVIEFFILFGYGQLAGRAAEAARSPRFENLTNRAAGTFLIAAGVALARLRRA